MANRWGKNGSNDRLYFLGSKITADGDCSHEIKSRLLLGRKVMTHLDSILKSRDITLPTKVRPVKAMVYPVVMYGCESWTIKKAEHQRIDVFELWCWRRLLRIPWTARRSNKSVLREINPEYSLEGLMLKLKYQYFGLLIRKADSLEKTLMLGKIEGRRRKGWQKMRRLDGITDSKDMSEWSRSLLSDSLRPHGLKHTRPPYLKPTPRVYSNSCPLSQWCHTTISSSLISLSSHLQSFPKLGSFYVNQSFISGDQSTGVSASASVLLMNIQDWFPLGWTSWISLLSRGLSRVGSNITVQKHQSFSIQLSL